ncbi:RTA1 domain-containing protein [Rhodotorula paludigena]|uniref:RTA1 domain-containing protein n=1 Tax=Rhodotorula paludigena TaxID=86838 RepID=UPI003175D2BB
MSDRNIDPALLNDPTRQYGYVPSVSMGVIFLVIFALSGLLHVGQTIYSRRYWWTTLMWVGNLLEILGWAGRLWAHWAPLSFDAYVMQICCLIIGPTFFSAALYWAGGVIINNVARDNSWLSGNWFKTVFIIADVVSLVIQAVGGGMAGSAVGTTNEAQMRNGSNIMLAGIVVQLAVMVFYTGYMAVWYWKSRPEVAAQGRKIQIMLGGLLAASIGIIIRGCYRTPELEEGFDGWIAQQQIWMLFDAIPIAFATFVINLIHPHWFMVFDRPSSAYVHEGGSETTMVPNSGVANKTTPAEKGQPQTQSV